MLWGTDCSEFFREGRRGIGLVLRINLRIRILPVCFVAFGVVEEVAVHVFEVGFLLFLGEVSVPDGDVEGAADLLHHGEGELASFAGFLNLFVVELLGGGLDEEVV